MEKQKGCTANRCNTRCPIRPAPTVPMTLFSMSYALQAEYRVLGPQAQFAC